MGVYFFFFFSLFAFSLSFQYYFIKQNLSQTFNIFYQTGIVNMASFIILLLIIVPTIFTISPTTTVTTAANAQNPLCNSPTFSAQSLNSIVSTSPNNIDFDTSSSYYDTTSSKFTPIMVKKVNTVSPYKFIYLDSNSVKQQIPCLGTAGYSFVRLLNEFLFLKKTALPDEYYICKLTSAVLTTSVIGLIPIKLKTISQITASHTNFVPYSVRPINNFGDWVMYVTISTSQNGYVAKYLWTTAQNTYTLIDSRMPAFNTFDGVQNLVLSNSNEFKVWDQNTDPLGLISSSITNPTATQKVVFYRTLTTTSFVGVYSADRLTAKFYMIEKSGSPSTVSTTLISDLPSTAQTNQIIDFFDDSNNILIIVDDDMLWINVAVDGTVKRALIGIGDVPRLNLQSVVFSGAKAMFTYKSKALTYQITANNAISRKFQHIPSTGLTLTGDYKMKYSITCFCQILKQARCFSSTLNCIAVKKGLSRCSNQIAILA